MNEIINKVLIFLSMLFIAIGIFCYGALNLMAQMNDDMQYDHTTSGSTLSTSHDPYVRSYVDGYRYP